MDRDKVIAELMMLVDRTNDNTCEGLKCSKIAEDVLSLLKEQEAVKPVCKIIFDIPYYFCGQCNEMLNMYSTKAMFCSKCGHPVKWGTVK